MDDSSILRLCQARDESVLPALMEKNDAYLMKIARNFLSDNEDCRECLNDAYYRFWKGKPPGRSDLIRPALVKHVREAAIDIYRKNHRNKRISSEFSISLEELSEIIPDSTYDPLNIVEIKELASSINQFLSERPRWVRTIMIMRYYYADSISNIVAKTGYSRSKVTVTLSRERKKLADHLRKEGFIV